MKVKTIIDEDFVNYKKPSMVVGFSRCSFKCNSECRKQVCQNSALATAPDIEISTDAIVERFMTNNLTSAVVMAGLDPFETPQEMILLVNAFRLHTDADIVIYTGFDRCEVENYITALKAYPNIIVKFGRFIPDANHRFDEVLGVELASENQYAERIS